MAAMNRLDRSMLEYAALPLIGYICTKTFGVAKTAARVTVPQDAVAVVFGCMSNFVALGGDVTVTVAWPTNIDDGTGVELNPTIRRLDGTIGFISVMMDVPGEISLRFLSKPA